MEISENQVKEIAAEQLPTAHFKVPCAHIKTQEP